MSAVDVLVYCGPTAMIAVVLWMTIFASDLLDLSPAGVRVVHATAGVVTLLMVTATFLVASGGRATTRQGDAAGSRSEHGEVVEAFVNVSRRLQSLAGQQIALLDELESLVEDPVLLKGLFRVDHLGTRMRREAESIAVLGGVRSWRVWRDPVEAYEVLRSAGAETEDYRRVTLVPPVEGRLAGVAVADVIHLMAALVENATRWGSTKDTEVEIRASHIAVGLVIEIDDRGRGIDPAERQRLNDVLRDPGQLDAVEQLKDGRIGLFVVATLARRHGIHVELQTNVFGGTRAVVVLPRDLLDTAPVDRSRLQVARAGEGPMVSAASTPGTAAAGSGHAPGAPRPPADAGGDAASASGGRQAPTGGRPALPRRAPRRGEPDEQAHAPAQEAPTQRSAEDAGAYSTNLVADLRTGYSQAAQDGAHHQS